METEPIGDGGEYEGFDSSGFSLGLSQTLPRVEEALVVSETPVDAMEQAPVQLQTLAELQPSPAAFVPIKEERPRNPMVTTTVATYQAISPRIERSRAVEEKGRSAAQAFRLRQREQVEDLEEHIGSLEREQSTIREQRDAMLRENAILLERQKFLRAFLQRAVMGIFPSVDNKPKVEPAIKQEPLRKELTEKVY